MISAHPETNPLLAFSQWCMAVDTKQHQQEEEIATLKTKVASYSQLLGDLNAKQAMTLLGLKKSAFYDLIKTVDLVKRFQGKKQVFCLDKVEAYKASLTRGVELKRVTRRKPQQIAA